MQWENASIAGYWSEVAQLQGGVVVRSARPQAPALSEIKFTVDPSWN